MPEEPVTQPSEEPTSPSGDEGQTPPESTPLTAEELDTQWRNRMSQRDKAHNEELRVLREQLSGFQTREEQSRRDAEAQRLANMSAAERAVAERDAAREELAQEKAARTADVRRLKYPNVAVEFDDQTLAAMDEAKLASLEAKVGGSPAPVPATSLIDPNSAARTAPAAPVSPKDKTKEELLADLKAATPSWAKTG